MNTLQQKIESLLFFKNEPVSFSWLAKQLEKNIDDIRTNIEQMPVYYEQRGLCLIISDDSVSLVTANISDSVISQLSRHDEGRELSKQALETLSIILYKGKVIKSELDYIRGVNSVFILRNLMIRGLIEKKVNPNDRRSPLYAVTHDTYSFLNIHKQNELPDFEIFSKKMKKLENEWVEEENIEVPLSDTTDTH